MGLRATASQRPRNPFRLPCIAEKRPRGFFSSVPIMFHGMLTSTVVARCRPTDSAKIRTSLGGETIVGRYQVEDRRFLLSDRPTNLIYSDGTGRFHPVHLMMPYSSEKPQSEQTGTLVDPPSYPRPEDFPDSKWYFSSAPLDNVSWIQLFHVEDGVHCRGLLLEYVGGGQRALGQCRLGVDRSKTYSRPSNMAFANVTRPRRGSDKDKIEMIEATRVGFDDVTEDDGAWTRFAMAGTLRFWFTYEEARLEVV